MQYHLLLTLSAVPSTTTRLSCAIDESETLSTSRCSTKNCLKRTFYAEEIKNHFCLPERKSCSVESDGERPESFIQTVLL